MEAGNDFDQKYNAYAGMVYKIAMTYLGSKADAEDVMQDAFMKLLYSSPEFKDEEHERRWMICVTSNLCKNALKSFSRSKTYCLEDFAAGLSVDFEYRDAELLFSLKPEQRVLLYLRYYECYSVEEISQILGLSRSCIKMRLKRGREKLRLDLTRSEIYE